MLESVQLIEQACPRPGGNNLVTQLICMPWEPNMGIQDLLGRYHNNSADIQVYNFSWALDGALSRALVDCLTTPR